MARYERDHPGYRAGLQLNLRERPEGGAVRSPCEPRWTPAQARPQPELLVLVHGFNNHRAEAQEAYAAFRMRQRPPEAAAAGRFEALLADVFWPGDADYAGASDLLDFLVYPATIPTARQVAVELCNYLRSRTDVLQLSFVGHSMGCRVVLETIRLLRAAGHAVPIRRLCLMAAAVRTTAVLPGGELEPALRAADQVLVLHSAADLVLSVAFPLGQTLAGDGFMPEAVGLHGAVARTPGRVDARPVEGAAHGDYWGRTPTAASAQAAAALQGFLGIGEAGRELPTRALAQRPAPPARPTAAPREPGDGA